MDTKWKSKKVLLSAILFMSFGLTVVTSLLHSGQDYLRGDYYQTGGFQTALNRFWDYVILFDIGKIDEEGLVNRISVSEDEIDAHRYAYGNLEEQIASIKAQYETRITDLQKAGSDEAANVLIKERDEKINDITLNFTSDEHVRQKIVAEKTALIEQMINEADEKQGTWKSYLRTFSYYLKDEETGEVYTSLSEAQAKDYKDYFSKENMRFVQQYSSTNNLSLDTDIAHSDLFNIEWVSFESIDSNHDYTGYVGIAKNVSSQETLVKAAAEYKQFQIYYISMAVIGLFGLVYSVVVIVKSHVFTERNKLFSSLYNHLPFDLRIAIMAVSAFICIGVLLGQVGSYQTYVEYDFGYWKYDWVELVWKMTYSTATLAISAIFFVFFLNSIRGKKLIENVRTSILYKGYELIKKAFLYMNVGIQLLVLLVGVFIIGVIFAVVLMQNYMGDFIVFLLVAGPISLVILYLIFKSAGQFNQIVKTVNGIAAGRTEEDLDIRGQSVFAKLAADVNALKHGVKLSQQEQVKSERLKTELITNVSHDLRTPLTSIITYSDLLKSEQLTEDERKSYVEIIDRKSKRLKVLIEDLFEASKMASGNIELVKTEVDVVQLLQQALAEYDERIEESQLQFRVTHDEPPITAYMDGQKMWRVFDNLIDNILKYAMPHTRVYIHLKNAGDKVEISFKNISQFELGCDVDELFERFKRGDQSRKTEGSGLGLAIAKSIIDLHEGKMDIDVDGDLFKVNIVLKK